MSGFLKLSKLVSNEGLMDYTATDRYNFKMNVGTDKQTILLGLSFYLLDNDYDTKKLSSKTVNELLILMSKYFSIHPMIMSCFIQYIFDDADQVKPFIVKKPDAIKFQVNQVLDTQNYKKYEKFFKILMMNKNFKLIKKFFEEL